MSDNRIGYVHLRAMTSVDVTQWFRNFYPVFNRPGLIIDARHNRGGNIDSFILARLLRKPWMYWQDRAPASRPGTCNTHSAATLSCWWTKTLPRMVKRSPKDSDALDSAK